MFNNEGKRATTLIIRNFVQFSKGEDVQVRNFSTGPTWLTGVIEMCNGSLFFSKVKHHINHVAGTMTPLKLLHKNKT